MDTPLSDKLQRDESRNSQAYKDGALALAEQIGVSMAAAHKKGRCVLCQEPQVKYASMRTHALRFPMKIMCRVLVVARSGFSAWYSRRASMRYLPRTVLDRQAVQIYSSRKGRSGLHGCATICGKPG